jgi:RNA polymerase sigma-70 factor (ECF subfamily)
MTDACHHQDGWQQAALHHLDALYGFAMALTANEPDAEDLVQETYMLATQNFGRLRPDSNLKGWLFIIMRNTWIKSLRSERRKPDFVTLDHDNADHRPSDHSSDPQAIYLSNCEAEDLRAALKSLPSAYREMIVLRDIEGFSYKEMAATLKCPVGSIMSRLSRSRAKLRSLLSARETSILQRNQT